MPAARSQVVNLAGTIMGAGTPQILDLPGTKAPGLHRAGATPYFYLEGGIINNIYGPAPSIIAFLNGTAMAAGTVAMIGVQAQGSTPFSTSVPGKSHTGIKIDQPGGLATKFVGGGTTGTVSMTLFIQDVLE